MCIASFLRRLLLASFLIGLFFLALKGGESQLSRSAQRLAFAQDSRRASTDFIGNQKASCSSDIQRGVLCYQTTDETFWWGNGTAAVQVGASASTPSRNQVYAINNNYTNATSTATADIVCDGAGSDCTGRARSRRYTSGGNARTEYTDTAGNLLTRSIEVYTGSDFCLFRTGQACMATGNHDENVVDVTTLRSGAADPADTGFLRLGNAEQVCWEASPAGTDVCATVNASEQFEVPDLKVTNGLSWEAQFELTTCVGGVAARGLMDSPTLTEPAAACVAGGSFGQGYADFDAAADEGGSLMFKLPKTWAGTLDAELFWIANATTGTANFCLQTACVGSGNNNDQTPNAAQCVSTTTNGTANQENITTWTGLTTTGCDAGERMYLRLYRDGDGSQGTDSLTVDARGSYFVVIGKKTS